LSLTVWETGVAFARGNRRVALRNLCATLRNPCRTLRNDRFALRNRCSADGLGSVDTA